MSYIRLWHLNAICFTGWLVTASMVCRWWSLISFECVVAVATFFLLLFLCLLLVHLVYRIVSMTFILSIFFAVIIDALFQIHVFSFPVHIHCKIIETAKMAVSISHYRVNIS